MRNGNKNFGDDERWVVKWFRSGAPQRTTSPRLLLRFHHYQNC